MKTIVTFAAAAAIAMSCASAQAGGWGKKGGSNGLVSTGNVNVLNGTSVLNGSPILSGNVVSGILNGNHTSVGNGILGGSVIGILGGNGYKAKKRR